MLAVALTNIGAPAMPIAEGRSVEGRPLTAVRIGDPRAPRRVLVVGSVHGDEPGGRRVTRALLRRPPPAGGPWWIGRDPIMVVRGRERQLA